MELLVLLAAFITAVAGQYSIKMKLERSRVRQGEEVKATCHVTNHLNKTVLLYWVKRVGQEETEIGVSNHLGEIFRKTDRYSVHYDVKKQMTEFVFTLTIKDAQAVDSGEIGCRIPNPNIEIFKKLLVLAQITSVRLASRNEDNTHAVVYVDKHVAEFKEGGAHKFSCHVNGSYPKPEVKIQIGDKDITSEFREESEEVVDSTMRGRYYKVTLFNDALKINYTFNEKNLTCTGRVILPSERRVGSHNRLNEEPMQWFPPVSSSIKISLLSFRPIFLCPRRVTASMYDSRVKMSCPVLAKPPVRRARFVYTVLSAVNRTVQDGESYGGYIGQLINQTKLGAENQTVELMITNVFSQHFRKYYFLAENSEGTSVHEIQLIENHPTSSADLLSPTHLLLCLFGAISILRLPNLIKFLSFA